MLRPSPVSRLLAARDQVYAHFQLQAECDSMKKRQKDRVSRKQAGTQKKSLERVIAELEKEKERSLTPENVVKDVIEVKESPRHEGESNGDLESRHSTTLGKPLYVTSGLKLRVFPDFIRRMSQLFNDDGSRRALVCALTAMISQQLCGVNTIGKDCLVFDTSIFFSYSKPITSFPWACPDHNLSKLISLLLTAFLSTTLLNGVNASPRTGAWVGFGIGFCNFV
jgi:hypothetical protein